MLVLFDIVCKLKDFGHFQTCVQRLAIDFALVDNVTKLMISPAFFLSHKIGTSFLSCLLFFPSFVVCYYNFCLFTFSSYDLCVSTIQKLWLDTE